MLEKVFAKFIRSRRTVFLRLLGQQIQCIGKRQAKGNPIMEKVGQQTKLAFEEFPVPTKGSGSKARRYPFLAENAPTCGKQQIDEYSLLGTVQVTRHFRKDLADIAAYLSQSSGDNRPNLRRFVVQQAQQGCEFLRIRG